MPVSHSGAAEAPALDAARALIDGLLAAGVRHAVLAPGSRSAPLAYAAAEASERGELELTVRLDERSAAFVALGISLPGQGPAVVITTSGSAAANLFPAIVEADAAGVPLIAVTADRPIELHGVGANQTMDQAGIFGSAVRRAVSLAAPNGAAARADWGAQAAMAVAASRGEALPGQDAAPASGRPGPVHLNCQFREPLTPLGTGREPLAPRTAGRAPTSLSPLTAIGHDLTSALHELDIPHGPRTVVVAGAGAGQAARRVAEQAGWPLFAEPHSGARCGPMAVGPYRLLLALGQLRDGIERVVVFGRPTLSRPLISLASDPGIEVIQVHRDAGPWFDIARHASRVARSVNVTGTPEAGAQEFTRRWLVAAAAAQNVVDQSASPGPRLARAFLSATGLQDLVLAAASNPIRDLDLVDPTLYAGRRVFANRGLAGIDGTLSTGVGLALGGLAPEGDGAVRVLIGDLAFLHDVGGLLRGTLERDVPLLVVVANDHGGSIFATLEHGEPGREATFERLFATPQQADIVQVAAGYGAEAVRVQEPNDIAAALAAPIRGRRVVEVPLPPAAERREASEKVSREAHAAALAAIGRLTPRATSGGPTA